MPPSADAAEPSAPPMAAPTGPVPASDAAVAKAEPTSPAPADAPAPPQPPLPPSDAPFTLPAIVHGIDPDEVQSPVTAPANRSGPLSRGASGALSTAVTDVLSSITAGVQRAVGLAQHTGLAATRHAHMTPLPPLDERPTILLFGDSLTARADHVSTPEAPGWAALMRETYGGRATVALSGHSGYNTAWALHLLPSRLRALCASPKANAGVGAGAEIGNGGETTAPQQSGNGRPTAVVLFWGANDACAPDDSQHVPLQTYVANLGTMVRTVRAAGATPVLISPPAFGGVSGDGVGTENADAGMGDGEDADGGYGDTGADNGHQGGGIAGGRRPDVTKKYAEACVKMGRQLGVPVVDLCEAMSARAATDPNALDSLLSDGLHLSAMGNRLVFDLLMELFADALPDMMPAALPDESPPWQDVDPADPAKALGPCELST